VIKMEAAADFLEVGAELRISGHTDKDSVNMGWENV